MTPSSLVYAKFVAFALAIASAASGLATHTLTVPQAFAGLLVATSILSGALAHVVASGSFLGKVVAVEGKAETFVKEVAAALPPTVTTTTISDSGGKTVQTIEHSPAPAVADAAKDGAK